MNKVILVIDDPRYCGNCPLAKQIYSLAKERSLVDVGFVCGVGHSGEPPVILTYEAVDIFSETKPDWCPLKPAPKLIEINYGSDEQDWEKGYNSCVEEIVGE